MALNNDTIYAPATPPGISALAIVRISGPEAIAVAGKLFTPASGKVQLAAAESHTAHFGTLSYGNELIDEVVLTLFRSPRSYTGDDLVEISCHGSSYVTKRICEVLALSGLRFAEPGEFTLRAFMNGKLDLSQAEAVADLIAAGSRSAHELAIKQMRGGFSADIRELRSRLLEFASLIGLELDFSEEDVEFADRSALLNLLQEIEDKIQTLISSFAAGNVMKSGIPVAIAGKPNVGKSTLLNAILNEERAIVSELPGTTRDTIEDVIQAGGLSFRFIDTAGLRKTGDQIEQLGINRAKSSIENAHIVLYVADVSQTGVDEIEEAIGDIQAGDREKKIIIVVNKTDLMMEAPHKFSELMEHEVVFVSAKRRENIHLIMESLLRSVETEGTDDRTLVSNARHHAALVRTLESVQSIRKGIDEGLSGDLLSTDLNFALHHLGEITGEITTDEILGNIFGKFCIGK